MTIFLEKDIIEKMLDKETLTYTNEQQSFTLHMCDVLFCPNRECMAHET